MKRYLILLVFSANCFASPLYSPNSILTPGAINPVATTDVICVPGYTSGLDKNGDKVRAVSEATKRQVFINYKIDKKSDQFEVDHLISLQLGGSNNISNLWPQSYTSEPYNAVRKDALENRLHSLVCSGKITLREAQSEIAIDWISAYKKYFDK